MVDQSINGNRGTDNSIGGGVAAGNVGGIGATDAGAGEGFANHPHIALDNRISEDASAQGTNYAAGTRDFGAYASRFGTQIRDYGTRFYSSVSPVVRDYVANPGVRSREIATRVDSHARSNPWLHIGLVGFGSLLLGYLFGRRFRNEVAISGSTTSIDE